MIKLLADEDLRGAIIRGLRRRLPDVDIIRVQDVGLSGLPDPEILQWASEDSRVVVTHDRNTMPGFAFDIVKTGRLMSGVIVVDRSLSSGRLSRTSPSLPKRVSKWSMRGRFGICRWHNSPLGASP